MTKQEMELTIKEPVKIRRKEISNGNISLYLSIYLNGRREYEFLKLYLIPEKTKADKERNRQTLALANSIKAQRIVDIQNNAWGFKSDYKENALFLDYIKAMAEKRRRRDSEVAYSNWRSCILHIMAYDNRPNITFADITPINELKLVLEDAKAQNQALNKTIHRLENTEETE